MHSASDQIVIDASPETLYRVVADPQRLPQWMSSLIEVRNIRGSGVGQTYEWTYKMAGVKFDGKTEVVEVDPGKIRNTRTVGGIASEWHMRIEPEGKGSRFHIEVTYSIPTPVLGALAEKVITARNRRELSSNLAHLKDIVEAEIAKERSAPKHAHP
ncbi:MAG: SRPBCC family protein [Sandaracinaceae bacterium]